MKLNITPEKKKRIIKGLILCIVPVVIFAILVEKGILGNIAGPIMAIGMFISLCYGIILLFTDPDEFDNSNIMIAGHVIDHEDLKKLKNMSLWQKIKTLHIIDVFLLIIFFFLFMISVILIIEDPLNFLERFSNPGRIQLILILILVFGVNGIYMYRRKDAYPKWQRITFWIICIGLFGFFMYKTTPRELDTREYTYDTFSEIISDSGYTVTEANEVDKLDLKNSKALLAVKYDIMIYFIEKDKEDTDGIIKTFESFDNSDLFNKNCESEKIHASISGNYKDLICEEPDYVIFAYTNRNTMVYVKTVYDNKSKVEELLRRIEYIE